MFFALVVMGLIMVTFVRIINHALSNPQDKSFPGFGQETGTKADAPTADDDFEPIPFDDDEPKVQTEEPVFEDEPVMQQSAPEEPEPVMAQPAMDYSSFDRLFGLIGKPLAHSTSKTRFNTLFQREHLNAYYENFELDSAEQVKQLVENNPNLCGFNVTIPYKQDIIPLLDRLDETAKTIGAVNTVKVMRRDGKTELVGYNTDWIGFNKSFGPLLEGHRKALILGTGGVSKAVKYALDTLGIENRFVSRNSNFEVLGYYELSPSVMDDFDVIVNCTPMGMWPHTDQCPDIPYTFLSDRHLLLDVIANPDETLFMKKGREHGATAKGGKDMLEQQAVAAWDIWNRIGE